MRCIVLESFGSAIMRVLGLAYNTRLIYDTVRRYVRALR